MASVMASNIPDGLLKQSIKLEGIQLWLTVVYYIHSRFQFTVVVHRLVACYCS